MEIELRAQIETVLAARLAPTHLDWHCLYNGGRTDIFALTIGLAREYGLAMCVCDRAAGDALRIQGLSTGEQLVMDTFTLENAGKSAWFARALHKLPAGLSKWAAHAALDTPEIRAYELEIWQNHFTDLDFLVSQEARALIVQQGIILPSYMPLQQVWQAQSTAASEECRRFAENDF